MSKGINNARSQFRPEAMVMCSQRTRPVYSKVAMDHVEAETGMLSTKTLLLAGDVLSCRQTRLAPGNCGMDDF